MRALLDGRPKVMVGAGAGSGKTRLLVAYFVHALVAEGIPAERMVAVTFTRRAAAELVSRIRVNLEDCGRRDLARSLDSAMVGTIHGLCRRLIREHALMAGVDPVGAILEADGAALMKEKIARRAWESVVARADENMLKVLADHRKTLRREMVPLYDRLRGLGWERPQLEPTSPDSDEGAGARLTSAVRDALSAGYAVARPGVALQKDLAKLEECLAWLLLPVAWGERTGELGVTGGFFPSRTTKSMEEWFGPVREALTAHRRALAGVDLRAAVTAMNLLLSEFHDQYEARKRERGALDFADLELRARALSRAGSQGRGSSILSGSRILIDEFQDTNELQCSILEGLGADRMLMVGDERQSIYRFRGADVAVFRDRRQRLESGGEAGSPGAEAGSPGGLHRLDTNYRSSRVVLEFINRLFAHERFFGDQFTALVYPDGEEGGQAGSEGVGLAGEALGGGAAPARASAPAPSPAATPAGPAVKILVVQRERAGQVDAPPMTMQAAEAEALGACARRMVDDEGWRQGEIVLLLPAQTHVDLYQKALQARGLDVYVVRGKGYYSLEEVADVTSLLRVLVNPHDDLALVATLRSPLVGLSDDGLYLLGRENRRARASLWDTIRCGGKSALGVEDRQVLAVFVERLTALRRRVGRPGLAQLIDDAVSACGYDLSVLATPNGKRRFANLRKLMRVADGFEALEGPDLAGFVEVLGGMDELSDREGSAPTLAEGENVVRIMTVHQAKGLEFPVVLLGGLGSDVPRPKAQQFMVGSDGRVGVFLKDSQRKGYEDHDLCLGPAVEILRDEQAADLEEDTRLLYVAMTRAKQRLVLVGARPRGDNLEKSRIGRIVGALGLGVMPEDGAIVPLEGLTAVVEAVAPEQVEPVPNRELGDGAGFPGGDHRAAICPSFPRRPATVSGPRQVSFSALAAYQRCPRRFYLERHLNLGFEGGMAAPDSANTEEQEAFPAEIFIDDERGAAREIGLLVHALLERSSIEERMPTARGIPPAEGVSMEERLRGLSQAWLDETGIVLSPAGLDRAVALVLAFLRSPAAEVWRLPTALRETPFFFLKDGVTVSGFMDLVSRTGDYWHIVDYKTNALQGRAPAELVARYELQAVTYCLAALRSGAPAVRMDFVFLERPEEPFTVTYASADIPALESRLADALEGLAQGRFPALREGECATCAVAALCERMAG